MKDWKKIADASGLPIPPQDLEHILLPLDGLEAAFRPLLNVLPHEVEPAVTFHADVEEAQ